MVNIFKINVLNYNFMPFRSRNDNVAINKFEYLKEIMLCICLIENAIIINWNIFLLVCLETSDA